VRAIFDVITVGSNVVDVLVRTSAEQSDLIRIQHGKKGSPVEDLVAYPVGGKILIKHLEFQTGGGGTNTAVSFKRLGFSVGYVGKIGKDENGLKVFHMLEKEGITFLGSLGTQNGYSIILDSLGTDRTLFTYKGCNNELSFSELHKSKLQAKAYYFCSMMGKSLKTLTQIAKHAKKQKALVAFNPSSYLTHKGVDPIKDILLCADVLILNREEAFELGGYGSDIDILKRLNKLGPSTVVMTDGADPVHALHGGKYFQVQPPKIRVNETTGAGDAFGSTLVSGLLMKKSFPQALRMSMINAESVIAHYGAKNILMSKKTLLQKLSVDKRKVKKRCWNAAKCQSRKHNDEGQVRHTRLRPGVRARTIRSQCYECRSGVHHGPRARGAFQCCRGAGGYR